MVAEANLTLQAADTQIGVLEQRADMMERDYRCRLESLQARLSESESSLQHAQEQYQTAMASKAGMKSQIESLQSCHDRLLSEFKTTASTMSERWASAQVQFFKDTDQAISHLHHRIQSAIKCQNRLASLLQRSIQKCSCLAVKLDQRNQRIETLKLVLRRDFYERDKVQKAYESGLLQIDRLNQSLHDAQKKATELELVRDQCQRRLTEALSERSQLDQDNDQLRSALNTSQEKLDLVCSHNRELKCEVELQRSVVERYLTEERSRELQYRGEAALHQSARRHAERELRQDPSRSQFNDTDKIHRRSVTIPASTPSPAQPNLDHIPLYQHSSYSEILRSDDPNLSSKWYQELLTKMNGLISKVDQSIDRASNANALDQSAVDSRVS